MITWVRERSSAEEFLAAFERAERGDDVLNVGELEAMLDRGYSGGLSSGRHNQGCRAWSGAVP